jgi:hypothetical protein
MSGWLKIGLASDYLNADVCKKIAHSPRKLLIEKIAHEICSQLANLL